MALGYEKEVKRQLTRAQIERRERRKQRMLGAGMEGKVDLHAAMSKKIDAKPEAEKPPTNLSIAYFRKKADEKRRAAAAKRVTEAGRRAAAPAGTLPVPPIHKALKRKSKTVAPPPVVKPVVQTVPTRETTAKKIADAREAVLARIADAREAGASASEIAKLQREQQQLKREAVLARRKELEKKIKKSFKGAWQYLTKPADPTLRAWHKLSDKERKKYKYSYENYKKQRTTRELKKGGFIKKATTTTTKRTSRKKSIDGIARKGHTRAKHK